VLAAALFIRLGLWQRHKAQLSAAAVAQYQERARLPPRVIDDRMLDPERMNAAPVTVRGRYEAKFQFFLDNRQNDGVPGVQVLTPLRIDPGEVRILVNRGWIAWPHGRGTLPEVPVPEGLMQVTGVAEVPSTKPFFLMPDHPEPSDRLWSRVDLTRFARLTQHPLQPAVLLQNQSDSRDALVRHWPPPADKTMMHRGYEYQWFGMAAALGLFYGFSVIRRRAA